MIEAQKLPEYFAEIAKLNPQVIHRNLKEGDEFSTHPYPTAMRYRVDEPSIHEQFGNDDNFNEFLLEVGKRVQARSPAQVLNELFPPGKQVCAISEIVQRNIGMCLEKAAMVALRTRDWKESMLIKGLLSAPGSRRRFHAFNVLAQDSNSPLCLADGQNPIIANTPSGKIHYPFSFPLRGYDEEDKRFIFEEPYQTHIAWSYQLPLNIRTP